MNGMNLIKGGLWLMVAGAAFVMAAIVLVVLVVFIGAASTLV